MVLFYHVLVSRVLACACSLACGPFNCVAVAFLWESVSSAGRLYGLLPAEPVRSRCYALSRAVFSRPVLSVGYLESVFIAVGVIAV